MSPKPLSDEANAAIHSAVTTSLPADALDDLSEDELETLVSVSELLAATKASTERLEEGARITTVTTSGGWKSDTQLVISARDAGKLTYQQALPLPETWTEASDLVALYEYCGVDPTQPGHLIGEVLPLTVDSVPGRSRSPEDEIVIDWPQIRRGAFGDDEQTGASPPEDSEAR